jgi:hypothetical protein
VLLAAACLACLPQRAAAAAADSLARPAAAAPDTLVRPAAAGDSLARPASELAADDSVAARPKLRWSEQPRFIMFRSAVLPGWGQLHNHAYFKALAVAGGEGWLIGGMVHDDRQMKRLLSEIDRLRHGGDQGAADRAVNEYNAHLDSFVSGQWLLGGVLAYALVDAYVDAHFRTFDLDFRTDPALPPDAAPEAPPAAGPAGKGTSARLSLRWHF